MPRSSVQTIIHKYKHHAIILLRKEPGSVSEKWLCFGEKCAYHCWLKPVRESHHPQWKSCTNMGWKATQQGRSHYSKSNIKKDDSLQMHTGAKTLILGTDLMKIKLNCLAIMIISTFGASGGRLFSPKANFFVSGHQLNDNKVIFLLLVSLRTPSQLWSTGVEALCYGGVFLQEGLVHFSK